VSTAAAAVAALAVLGAGGVVPALALVGPRWVLAPLSPLAGAVIAAVAAMGMLGLGGTIDTWFVGLAASLAVVVIVRWVLVPPTRPRRERAGAVTAPGRLTGWAGGVGVVAATAWSLQALRAPTIGFDARTVWMLHATWYTQGRPQALAALRNTALSFAHTAYPPLVGGSVAVSWLVTGDHSYRFGVVMVALLNACATMAVACAVADAGRLPAHPHPAHPHPGPPPPAHPHPWRAAIPGAVGSGAAVLLVLCAFGVAGPFATNGYADMLWAVSAAGAVGYGLVLPPQRSNLGVTIVLLAVAGLTKDEGYLTAVAIVVLVTLRLVFGPRRPLSQGAWRAVLGGAAGVVGLVAWPVLTRLWRAAPNVEAPGARQGTDASRLRPTLDAFGAHLHVLVLALGVALAGTVLLRRAHRATGMGSDGWAWAALAAGLAIVAVAYVTGPGDVQFWLVTSAHRTTFYPALVAWLELAMWAVVGAVHVAGGAGGDDAVLPRPPDL
jgi:hypothetical protein